MIADNLSIKNGQLLFAGQEVSRLAKEYGTPLYLMDEERIRRNCRTYREALKASFGENALPLYASKAASFKDIYRIVAQEGLGIDVVSAGEFYTAMNAGFPMEKAYFHGNSKTDDEIRFTLSKGVGYIVADNYEELDAIQRIAAELGITQKILLRLTPGIDTHTYEAVNTGKVDSKFGVAIETGQAAEMVAYVLTLKNVALKGFHCHIGSQVFDSDTFLRGADIMLTFMDKMRQQCGYTAEILDLGGGYGVPYLESDPTIDIAANIAEVAKAVKAQCQTLHYPLPAIRMEPGRSIVADAGLTVYTVQTQKKIPGYKTYISVNGGMADNPRYALYQSPYTIVAPEKMNEDKDLRCTVAGCCCESGDVLQENVALPSSLKRGDLLAVLTTGAYNYSMASNYNRIPRPPVVMLQNGESRIAVERESLEDLLKNDR